MFIKAISLKVITFLLFCLTTLGACSSSNSKQQGKSLMEKYGRSHSRSKSSGASSSNSNKQWRYIDAYYNAPRQQSDPGASQSKKSDSTKKNLLKNRGYV